MRHGELERRLPPVRSGQVRVAGDRRAGSPEGEAQRPISDEFAVESTRNGEGMTPRPGESVPPAAAVDVFEADDVVLSEVGAGLDFDQDEVDRARVLQAVQGAGCRSTGSRSRSSLRRRR